MTESEFKRYILLFETEVVISGINGGVFTKTGKVFVRSGRLASQDFGRSMGRWIAAKEPCAIDYYGYVKKSFGFSHQAEQMMDGTTGQIKAVEVPLVYFASIRVEKVAVLAPKLVADFPWFKIEVLNRRGFKHKFMEKT